MTPDLKGAPIYSPTPRPWWQVVLEFSVILLVTIVTLETAFAMAGIGTQEFLKPDPIAGYVPIEDKLITWRKEGFSRTQYNHSGLPDIERTIASHKSFRIAAMGDSMVESLQVERPQTFCNLLEKELNKGKTTPDYEVLNFGVSSYNLGQIYLRLKTRALSFHPDMVVLFVRQNCIYDLLPKDKAGFLDARPYFFVDANHNLVEDHTIQNHWRRSAESKRLGYTSWLRQHSLIWGVMSAAVEQAAGWWHQLLEGKAGLGSAVTSKQTAFLLSTSATSNGEHQLESLPPVPMQASQSRTSENDEKYMRYCWPIANALIARMKQLTSANNCSLVIVRLPSDGVPNQLETELLKDTAKSLNIPFLDTSTNFTGGTKQAPLFYMIHFTAAGHQVFAKRLTHFLQPLLTAQLSVRQSLDAGASLGKAIKLVE